VTAAPPPGHGVVLAVTTIRVAPAGREPGYVVALVVTEGGRALVCLDGPAPAPGAVVALGRADARSWSGPDVAAAPDQV
jgi:uncharacterized OB-fold protein